MRFKMASTCVFMLCWSILVCFDKLLKPFILFRIHFGGIHLHPLPRFPLSPHAHPQALSGGFWSSHYLSSLTQRPPGRLISELCSVQRTCRGVLALSGKWGGCVFFPLRHRQVCMNTRNQNNKSTTRTAQRSSVVIELNRLGCLLTGMSNSYNSKTILSSKSVHQSKQNCRGVGAFLRNLFTINRFVTCLKWYFEKLESMCVLLL